MRDMPTAPRKRLTNWPFLWTGVLPFTVGCIGIVVWALMGRPYTPWVLLWMGPGALGELSLVIGYLVLRDCETTPAKPYLPLLRWFFIVEVALKLGVAMVIVVQ